MDRPRNTTSARAALARQKKRLRQSLQTPISVEKARVALERKISLKFPHFKGFLTEYSHNLSMTGMFVRSDFPQPPGSIVAFEFQLADGPSLITGQAEVIWVRESEEGPDHPPGMGLRFVRLDADSRRLIQWAIEKEIEAGNHLFNVEDVPPKTERAPAGPAPGEAVLDAAALATAPGATATPGGEPAPDETAARSTRRRAALSSGELHALYPYARAAEAGASARPRRRARLLTAAAVALVAVSASGYLLRPASAPARFSAPAADPAAAGAAAPGTTAPDATARPAELDRQVAGTLDAWARAWSEQRADDHLAFYAPSFAPPEGLTRAAWATQRRARVETGRGAVTVSELEIEPWGAGRVRARLVQGFESSAIRMTVPKTLELVFDAGRWQIVAERSGP